jgi:hypothetical protein
MEVSEGIEKILNDIVGHWSDKIKISKKGINKIFKVENEKWKMKNGKWKMKNEIVKPCEEPCWYEKRKMNPVINLKDEIK